ncbi:MAG: AMMECR1 family protein [Spirochaetes bacterium]|nr:AMMECR1 family protein [Spirochaetota bacterium]
MILISCNNDFKSFKTVYNYEVLHKLLEIGRQSILDELKNRRYKHFVETDYSNSDIGVILRLKKQGKERGCIAFIKGIASLDIGTKAAAVNAAFFDSRFQPIKEDELKYLEIEIGVIGKFIEIKNKKSFKLGIDSLMLEYPLNRTFLQGKIAIEDKLNKTEFLNTLYRKAGLKEGTYKNKDIKIFKAPVVYLTEKFIIQHTEK